MNTTTVILSVVGVLACVALIAYFVNVTRVRPLSLDDELLIEQALAFGPGAGVVFGGPDQRHVERLQSEYFRRLAQIEELKADAEGLHMTMAEFLATTNFAPGAEPGSFVRVNPTDASDGDGFAISQDDIHKASGYATVGNSRHDDLKAAQFAGRLDEATQRQRAVNETRHRVRFGTGAVLYLTQAERDRIHEVVNTAQAKAESLDVALAAVIREVPLCAVETEKLEPHEREQLLHVLIDKVDREINGLDALLNAGEWREFLAPEPACCGAGGCFGCDQGSTQGSESPRKPQAAAFGDWGMAEEPEAKRDLSVDALRRMARDLGAGHLVKSAEEVAAERPSSLLDQNRAARAATEGEIAQHVGTRNRNALHPTIVAAGLASGLSASVIEGLSAATVGGVVLGDERVSLEELAGKLPEFPDLLYTSEQKALIDELAGIPKKSAPETSSTHARARDEVSQTGQKCQETRQNTGSVSQVGQKAALDASEIDFGAQRFPHCTRFGRHARRPGYGTSGDEGSQP